MVTMERSIIPVEDRRIVIPEDVYLALEEYAAKSRKALPKELQATMTAKSAAQSVMRQVMVRDGFLKRPVRAVRP